MHKNPVWIAFFALVLLITAYFLVKAGGALLAYGRLSEKAEGKIERVEVLERKGKFVVWGKFSFEKDHERVEAEGVVGKPFLNRFSAEKKASSLTQERVTVWYNPKNPKNAVLEKRFPFKKVISAAILAALTLYFFFLGRYIKKKGSA